MGATNFTKETINPSGYTKESTVNKAEFSEVNFSTDNLLLEDGTDLLLENGDTFLLEDDMTRPVNYG